MRDELDQDITLELLTPSLLGSLSLYETMYSSTRVQLREDCGNGIEC